MIELQQEVIRLNDAGRDVSEVRSKLGEFHAIHMQVLALQEQLQKALRDISAN